MTDNKIDAADMTWEMPKLRNPLGVMGTTWQGTHCCIEFHDDGNKYFIDGRELPKEEYLDNGGPDVWFDREG